MSTPLKELEKTARALSLIAEGMDLQNHLSEENGRLKQELAEAQAERDVLRAEVDTATSILYLELMKGISLLYPFSHNFIDLQYFAQLVLRMSQPPEALTRKSINQVLELLLSIVESLIAINDTNKDEASIRGDIEKFKKNEALLIDLLGDYWTTGLKPLLIERSRAEELLPLDQGKEE